MTNLGFLYWKMRLEQDWQLSLIGSMHGDVIRINREIFQMWLQGSGRHPITWGTLVQCLWDAELNNLADEIAAIKLQQ